MVNGDTNMDKKGEFMKFKVGDKIVGLEDSIRNGVHKNEVYTVVAPESFATCLKFKNSNGHEAYASEERFRLHEAKVSRIVTSTKSITIKLDDEVKTITEEQANQLVDELIEVLNE